MVAKQHGFTMLYALQQVDWVLSSESIFRPMNHLDPRAFQIGTKRSLQKFECRQIILNILFNGQILQKSYLS